MVNTFLGAPSHLYKRVCPSVRPSVRRSVSRSVRRSIPRYFQTRTRRILCRVSGLVFPRSVSAQSSIVRHYSFLLLPDSLCFSSASNLSSFSYSYSSPTSSSSSTSSSFSSFSFSSSSFSSSSSSSSSSSFSSSSFFFSFFFFFFSFYFFLLFVLFFVLFFFPLFFMFIAPSPFFSTLILRNKSPLAVAHKSQHARPREAFHCSRHILLFPPRKEKQATGTGTTHYVNFLLVPSPAIIVSFVVVVVVVILTPLEDDGRRRRPSGRS